MRLVQFNWYVSRDEPSTPVWVNPEHAFSVYVAGSYTRVCLGPGVDVDLHDSIEEVVRALAADPALEREHERLQLTLATARDRMRQVQGEVTIHPATDEDARWLHEADRDEDYAFVELQAFLAAYPQFNEAAP